MYVNSKKHLGHFFHQIWGIFCRWQPCLSLQLSPLDDEIKLVAPLCHLPLGLLVTHVEDVSAVDLDKVVAAADAGLASHAVQRDLKRENKFGILFKTFLSRKKNPLACAALRYQRTPNHHNVRKKTHKRKISTDSIVSLELALQQTQ